MDSTVLAFRKLHESGCFVLPNPWDPGSAVYLKSLGFKALATTSAGYAFSQALPDGSVPRDRMLRHIREIVAATPLPVNAAFEGGHAVDPEEPAIVAEVVKAVAPKPVNVLAGWPGFTVKQLEELGVRRISVGGAMARAAWAGFIQAARQIAEKGTFDGFAWATPGDELNALFKT